MRGVLRFIQEGINYAILRLCANPGTNSSLRMMMIELPFASPMKMGESLPRI